MRTLTEIFTPGAPTLPEGLRTLVVSPERELEPGMTVRATFTFRNQGGALASGVRVRMNAPDGLVYLVGSARVDDAQLTEEQGNCPLLSRDGAHVGDVAPGEERRVDLSYVVAGAIENGTAIDLQAAVAALEITPVGSNIVRLLVRSRPVLDNPLTNITIEARNEPRPGSEALVTVRLHNAGDSSARDVVIVAPIPPQTTYVANSARLNGRELEPELRVPFNRVYAPIVAPILQASATATLTYRVRIDEHLPNGTRIVARASVASQETSGFDVAPASLEVLSAPRFDDEQTHFAIEPVAEVEPGQRISVRLHAVNCGTTATHSTKVAMSLPDGLLLVRGSGRLDGRPVRDRRKELGSYELGAIDAGVAVDFTAEATVVSPQQNAKTLPIAVQLTWDGGERTFERSLTVNSQPYFDSRRTRIERIGSPSVKPGGEIEAAIALQNDGPAAATDCLLELHLDPALEALELFERNGNVTLENNTAEIDRVEPYSSRQVTVRARVRTPYADGVPVALSATLHTLELGETPLGAANFSVDSHPRFSNEHSTIGLAMDETLRPNQVADAYVRIVNEGTDTAHDVRLRLVMSPELRLDNVDGATRKKNCLSFGEIAAGRSAEARLSLRLLRTFTRDDRVSVDAVLTAASVLPVQLHGLEIATASEPDFSVGVLRSEPADLGDVGETVQYILHVHNGGDGTARRVQINVEPSDALIYVPNSTAVNGVPVRDIGSAPPLVSDDGIVLNEAEPGVEARITWREVVHNGLPAGESIVRIAHVRYDNERHDEFSSGELKVRATAVFANNIPGLPFGLNGIVGPAANTGTRALPDAGDGFVQLPPATPVAQETYWLTEPHDSLRPNGSASPDEMHVHGQVASACVFRAERFEKTLRFLKEAHFGTLVSHLFAIRAFFPTTISGSESLRKALEDERLQLRDALDRLFIKLRLPQYAPAARDIETTPMRRSLLELVKQLHAGASAAPGSTDGEIVLPGKIDTNEAEQLSARVQSAQLGTAPAWHLLAFIMPDGATPLGAYRSELLEQLEKLESLPPEAFCEALTHEVRALDAALEDAIGGLTAAV
ncbi:MAG: DUF11 domain-containing protein [Candidatus Eremiobacteraeota bacterium]|nr:DUF11 domain-containing protein [Candidatus Eremiobacteraeota bacterium]